MIGKTLRHYQVIEKLGEGGMGVVYKARDLHLDRFVAIKVLPPEKVADLDRKRRFVQEAKAASALNHPNIVTIHDITQEGRTDFIVMEYVEGKTLDQRIGHRGLRLADALKYAVQVADALAKAHSAGIIHRDLKPTNIMVNQDGVVKLLDFGLAKLTEWVRGDEFASTATMESEGRPITEEGVIVGTVAYMSPEQAEGKKVDDRSDIFSMGSVLYEMVTGQKAFQGTSKLSTLSAILHQEPKSVSSITPMIPSDLEKLINRCLRKDPAKRFQYMADVKVALDELKEDSDSGRLQAAPAVAKYASTLWLAFVGVVVVALAAAGWYWLRPKRTVEPEAVLTPVPLTSYPGYESTPSFNPDGTQVAFEWRTEEPEGNYDIYIKQIGFEPPFRLTTDRAEDRSPAWSPDGRFIAFLRRVSPTKATLIIMPQRGGQERVLGQINPGDLWGPCLTWTPDSKWLAFQDAASRGLFLLSIQSGERRRLTDHISDKRPAFSPDGRALAFTRGNEIDLLRLAERYLPQGVPELVTSSDDEDCAVGWTSDGNEILFSKNVWVGSGLWRIAVSASKSPRRLPLASEDYGRYPAVSRHGSRLAYTVDRRDSNIWRVEMREPGLEPGVPTPLISSTKVDYCPAYSPDGRKIAFYSTRSGAGEIWVCSSDGSNAVQLTTSGNVGNPPKWSPDGSTLAYTAVDGGYTSVHIISANGGAPRRLTTGPFVDRTATFSRDGTSIYFPSNRSETSEIWKIPSGGGDLVQITRDTGDLPQESPDGKFLYYSKVIRYPEECSVWRMPVGGGEETLVLDAVHGYGQWAFWKEGIYFFRPADKKGRSDICLYEFATGKTRKVLTIEKPIHFAIEASPDGRTVLYAQMDQSGSDLMLVENFR